MPDGDGRTSPAHVNRLRRPEAERLILCPECRVAIPEHHRDDHLIGKHGYLHLAGTLLSREAAVACLWDRFFSKGDARAQEQLWVLLAGRTPPNGQRPPYVAALEGELLRRLNNTARVRQELPRWIWSLRHHDISRTHCWDLLDAADSRVRTLVREAVLPDVGEALAGKQTTAADVRHWLERLCPADDIWEKIRVCQRLPQFGAARPAARDCLRSLQAERPVACPRCNVPVSQDQLEAHLRQMHLIYQFRGVQGSLPDTLGALLAAVCCAAPDYLAWQTLETLVREEYGLQAERFLTDQLGEALHKLPEATRQEVLPVVAEVIAGSDTAARLALYLAKAPRLAARRLGLALAVRLQPPLNRALVRALRRLLPRKRAPGDEQVAAAAALLRTTGHEGPAAAKVLKALLAGCRKVRSLERLRQLEEQAGPSSLIAARYAELENQIRMRCPRCRAQLRRPDMARHLWSAHGLLLDGRRVREPWRLIQDWVHQAAAQHDPELLVRCRRLGQYLDPRRGLQSVYRLFLASGIEDGEARRVLLAEVRQNHTSLCPHCFGQVPVPEASVPQPLHQSHGRLSLGGYGVEVSESRWVPQLQFQSRRGVLYRGREPRRWLTRRAAAFLFAGPPIVAGLVLAVIGPPAGLDPRLPVLGTVGLGLLAYVLVMLSGRDRPPVWERAIDYAWSRLVPRLHQGEFTLEDSVFLAGLAQTSLGRGRPEVRAESLERVLRYTENAVAGRAAPWSHLAQLRRLEIADAAALGKDPVPRIAEFIGCCFEGELPIAYAQALLADWQTAGWWTPANRARLRVLLCDRAFVAGLEVHQLLEAVQRAAALGDVLDLDYADELAQLRLLWSLRPLRPWDRWSDPQLIFDLAAHPEPSGSLLEKYPDLLLVDSGVPALFLCGRGIIFHDILFTQAPKHIEIKARKDFDRVDYEVVVGEHRFHLPREPEGLGPRLERWFRYTFHDFLPQVQAVHSWKPPADAPPLLLEEAVLCPDCRQLVVPRLGEVGEKVGSKG
jgi:hypothetical protein